MKAGWVHDILHYWFDELEPQDWFRVDAKTDRVIAERFADLHQQFALAVPDIAWTQPEPALAAILLFDQFPRNMFRGTPLAFSTDDQALELASNVLERGLDTGQPAQRRQFLYMPFQHSEVLADQERAVLLFRSLGDEEGLKYALEHRDIIARFGRFPHRNRVLQRGSTPEEEAFLAEHAGFGQ